MVSLFPPLPSSVVRALGSCSSLGVCGSRLVTPYPALWGLVVAAVPPSVSVSCGCVGGVCALARSSFPSVRVFSARSFGVGPSSFVRRSVALVGAVAVSPRPLWLSFPGVPCPPGLVPHFSPSRCFCGLGSGSWASLALAVGSGVPCLAYLGVGSSFPVGWSFIGLGGGWFFHPPII